MGGRTAAGWAAGAAILLCAGTAAAVPAKAPRRFRADLAPAAVVPAPKHVPRNAGGRFVGKVTGRLMEWTLNFHSLSGKVTSAHIHVGDAGHTGAVVVRLCGPCPPPATGKTKLTPAQLAAMTAKKLYVDIHTVKNPAGELRGQTYRR